MIKVLEEKPAPRATVVCNNCGSLLEYGNADLHNDYHADLNCTGYTHKAKCITCPVCDCEISVNWINRNV